MTESDGPVAVLPGFGLFVPTQNRRAGAESTTKNAGTAEAGIHTSKHEWCEVCSEYV
jgi:hypothetical protein